MEQSVARRAHNPKVTGSSPVPATKDNFADIAQSVERILGKDKVTSSILVISSISGGIAQLARACGSYPQCPEFKSLCRHQENDEAPPSGAFYFLCTDEAGSACWHLIGFLKNLIDMLFLLC